MNLRYSAHAVERLFQWDVTEAIVEAVLNVGELIESYPDDSPYPSRLVLGWDGDGSRSRRRRRSA